MFKRRCFLITSHPNPAPVFSECFCGLTRRKQPGKGHPAQISSSSSQHWGPWLSKGRPPCCHAPVQSHDVGKCVGACVKRRSSVLPRYNKVHVSPLLTVRVHFHSCVVQWNTVLSALLCRSARVARGTVEVTWNLFQMFLKKRTIWWAIKFEAKPTKSELLCIILM